MSVISLDRTSKKSLTRQLYEQMQQRILSGVLTEGYKLLSTRAMANELGVSRNVVLEAYDQLTAEGYIESRTGSGTFVAAGAVYAAKESVSLKEVKTIGFKSFNPNIIDFRSGVPDLSQFPVNQWIRITRDVYQEATPAQLAYGSPEGRAELREAIAEYVRVHRGVRCHTEQVLVTAGTTQAIGLVSRIMLHSTNKNVMLEDPITSDIRYIIEGFGGVIHPVGVDENGLKTKDLRKLPKPLFIYVTPSHQFPLGITMPIQRRVDLLNFVSKTNTYLVEDDYDSEFRYDAMPVNSIQGLDPKRVIYLGTFSKTLCPSIRVGYIILPEELIERGRRLKWFADLHNATMDQLVLARFIKKGYFARHVAKMKKIQKRKREVLIRSMEKHFGDKVSILGSATGLHLTARFPGVRFNSELLQELEEKGVKVYPVEEHAIRAGFYEDTIIIGYGMLDPGRIEKGVEILASVLQLN